MSAGLEAWLREQWYGHSRPNWMLKLLSSVYAALMALRRTLYERNVFHVQPPPVPTIVVGNVTVGGGGKTPVVIALVERLKQAGYKPGVVSRGYGRKRSAALTIEQTTPAHDCGDEPRLIFERTQCPVRVDADRVAACRWLAQHGCDVIVSDDGLQHLRMGRTLEIEVIDGHRLYGNNRLLPAGPLREPVHMRNGVARFRISSGQSVDGIDHSMHLGIDSARNLVTGEVRPLADFQQNHCSALAGIADPDKFFRSLRAAGLRFETFAFPDHHSFIRSELDALARPLLMTEKDAVKCTEMGLEDTWSVPLHALIDEQFYRDVLAELEAQRRPD